MARWYVGPNGEGAWADFNGNGIIDGDADFALLQSCYLAITRPGDPMERPECARFDLDQTGQVGASDFSALSDILATGFDRRTGTQLEPVPEAARRSLMLPLGIGAAVVALLALAGKARR